MKNNGKEKKQKTVYVDDGRTIADMSEISGGKKTANSEMPSGSLPTGSFKDKMQTYFNAMKMMFFPMLATMGAITVAFLILYLILELAS